MSQAGPIFDDSWSLRAPLERVEAEPALKKALSFDIIEDTPFFACPRSPDRSGRYAAEDHPLQQNKARAAPR
ncbi:MAG TPA: hypothetical protein VII64_09185 [Thermodesulfobacteriota bacterium]